jgi:flavin reductase (DIM6/NTAB) family NADH-FMN oxidoreductase RutF
VSEATPTIDPALFRQVLGCYPTGVTIVTASAGDEPVAMVIGSFGSVSLDPPLVMFLPGQSSSTWPRIEAAGAFCVNVLGDDQVELSHRFFSKDTDPWDGLEWTTAATGAPVLADALAWIDCEIERVVEAGDHWIVLGRVVDLEGSDSGGPLVFFRGGYGRFAG